MARRRRKPSPAKEQPVPTPYKPTRTGLNVDSTVAYLQNRPLSSLDGLFAELRLKLKQLGVKSNKRAHKVVPCNEQVTGNIAAVIKWVRDATEDDAETLQCIDAVIGVRMTNGGREVDLGE